MNKIDRRQADLLEQYGPAIVVALRERRHLGHAVEEGGNAFYVFAHTDTPRSEIPDLLEAMTTKNLLQRDSRPPSDNAGPVYYATSDGFRWAYDTASQIRFFPPIDRTCFSAKETAAMAGNGRLVLQALYALDSAEGPQDANELMTVTGLDQRSLASAIRNLRRADLVKTDGSLYEVTSRGARVGEVLVKDHIVEIMEPGDYFYRE